MTSTSEGNTVTQPEPRRITTTVELEALPDGQALRDDNGNLWEKQPRLGAPLAPGLLIFGPLTVVATEGDRS